MNFKTTLKKGSLIAALGLGLSAAAAVPGNNAVFAADNTSSAAQTLVNSLKALNIDQVDYLYAYLQSVNLSTAEYNGIIADTNRASQMINGTSVQNLTSAQKVEVLRLFLDSVKLSHLQASFTDSKGNPLDILNYKAGTTGVRIQLKDLKGNVMATIKPSKADLDPKVLQSKIQSLETAVQAKKQLEATGKFVPMPSGALPNTATNEPDYIALGGLLIILGGLALVPAAKYVRKQGKLSEV